jgi:hypothetical protein
VLARWAGLDTHTPGFSGGGVGVKNPPPPPPEIPKF